MCLQTKMQPKDRKKITDRIHRGGITVYKVVGVEDGKYFPPAKRTKSPYKEGLNTAEGTHLVKMGFGKPDYTPGFHFFKSKAAAKEYHRYLNEIVEESFYATSRAVAEDGETLHKSYKVRFLCISNTIIRHSPLILG